jgi:hypothetical protein
MSGIQPLPKPSEDRPIGQDLSGPEFLHYRSEWMILAQRLFILGKDKTDKHKVNVEDTLSNPSEVARIYHGEKYLEELKNLPRYRNELISSQNLYIDLDDYILELQMWNEEHPFGLTEETERDMFYIAFHYKKTIPEELQNDKINYAVISNIKEMISIVMCSEERQTNPKKASEITQVLKDLVSDPQIDSHFMDPEIAKNELSRIDPLN